MLGFVEHGDDRAVHDTLLHGLLAHIFLIVFEVDRVKELSVEIFRSIEAFQMFLIIHIFTEWQFLLIVYMLMTGTHISHDGDFRRNLAFRGPSLRQESFNR